MDVDGDDEMEETQTIRYHVLVIDQQSQFEHGNVFAIMPWLHAAVFHHEYPHASNR